MTLEVRWLGRVRYSEAYSLQRALHGCPSNYLLLMEHPSVYTMGVRTDPGHLLVDPSSLGAELVRADRGGDITYHGPGQLVGYPILSVPFGTDSTPRHVQHIEQLLIDVLGDFDIEADRLEGYPGVWVGVGEGAPRKIAAIGVRIDRGRSMHGFALNVNTDLKMFSHIVPCGISDKGVTSMKAEGRVLTTAQVAKRVAECVQVRFGTGEVSVSGIDSPGIAISIESGTEHLGAKSEAKTSSERLNARLRKAGVDPSVGLSIGARKPEWMRLRANLGDEYRNLRSLMRKMSLVTVCEEAGCPNIYECWAEGTATFMINGYKCTRACGFCLVDTSKPDAVDLGEPERVARAVEEMNLRFVVVTAVARDDLADGGASGFSRTIQAIRERCRDVEIEVLVPDCKGDETSLQVIFDASPEVFNHNLETVARLQRAVRPSAGYARSLSVLAKAKAAGLRVKSGLIVGMGEEREELHQAILDLRNVGVDILTIGQYLRPTAMHLPISRYYSPTEFEELREYACSLGFSHVEASPMTRSSYHARAAAQTIAASGAPLTMKTA